MRVVVTRYAHEERSVPGQNLDVPLLGSTPVFVVLVAIQRPCDQLDDTVEPHQELNVGDALDGNVHDQNSPVEVLAHVCLDRRHDSAEYFWVHGQ